MHPVAVSRERSSRRRLVQVARQTVVVAMVPGTFLSENTTREGAGNYFPNNLVKIERLSNLK